MLGNKEDKHFLRENTRLNFITSLQTPLLPDLLSLQVHSDPSVRQWVVWAVEASVQWFLSAVPCFSLISSAPHGSSTGCSPFSDEPALSWAYPQATVLLGPYLLQHGLLYEPQSLWECACSTIEQLLLWSCCSLCSLLLFFLLSFLKYVFTEAPQTPPNGLALACGGSIAKVAGNSYVCHRADPELFPQMPPLQPRLLLEPCHLHPIQKLAIVSLLLICNDLEKMRTYQELSS